MREKTISIGSPRDVPHPKVIDKKTRKITFELSAPVTAKKMRSIIECYPKLRVLVIEASGEGDVDLKFLRNLHDLQTLAMTGIRVRSFEHLTNLVSLTTLVYNALSYDDEEHEDEEHEDEEHEDEEHEDEEHESLDVSDLSNLVSLEEIQLNVSGKLEGVEGLEYLADLKRLSIIRTTEAFHTGHLSRMSIEDLVLHSCQLEGSLDLSGNRNLKTLSVMGNRLDEIIFSKRAKPYYINCRINEGLSCIKSLNPKKLRFFFAGQCSFNEISFLRDAPELEHVLLCCNPAEEICLSDIQESQAIQTFCTNDTIPYLQDCGKGLAAAILQKFMENYYGLFGRVFNNGFHDTCEDIIEEAAEFCESGWFEFAGYGAYMRPELDE